MRQVLPRRVTRFDQADLPSTNPALDLFFARNGVANVREPLEIDQPDDFVLAREAGDEALLVLIDPPDEVVGDASVQYTRATGHDVHAVGAHGTKVWDPALAASIIPRRPGPKPCIGGRYLFIHFLASGPVILSAAGAKDLLVHRTEGRGCRREGSASLAPQRAVR